MFSPRQYSIALYQATVNQDKAEIKKRIGCFVQLLVKNRDLKLIPKIIEGFLKYDQSQKGRLEVEIIVKEKLDASLKERLKTSLLEFLKSKEIKTLQLKETREPKILGGFIIQTDSWLIDGSVKRRIEELEERIISLRTLIKKEYESG